MIRQAECGRTVRLMFQDEARFGCINDPHRCWAPPGVRPIVGAHLVREYTHAFAALSPHDGTLDSLILPVVNAQTRSIFLDEVAKRHANEFILLASGPVPRCRGMVARLHDHLHDLATASRA